MATVRNGDFTADQTSLMTIVSGSDTSTAMYGYAVEKVIATTVDTEVRRDAKTVGRAPDWIAPHRG